MTGTLKTKNEKGFGFIAVQGQDDVYFHSKGPGNEAFDSLNEGDTVSFEMNPELRDGKSSAMNVVKA